MGAPLAAEPLSAPASGRDQQLAELGLAFKRVFRTLNRIRGRDTHLAGSQLSQAQFELLIELRERGELSAGELAHAARLAPGTVTQMLDSLADSGHVERARSELDRRVVVSRLTPLGESQIAAKREAWKVRWEGALEGVSEAELQAARTVLERLGTMFEETEPPDCWNPEQPTG
jgi:DNA-binding MarR family transcriptional regulator